MEEYSVRPRRPSSADVAVAPAGVTTVDNHSDVAATLADVATVDDNPDAAAIPPGAAVGHKHLDYYYMMVWGYRK